MVWVRDIMTVMVWDPALPAGHTLSCGAEAIHRAPVGLLLHA